MKIDVNLPVSLTAELGYDWSSNNISPTPRVVVVYFGTEQIIELPPVRENRAGHGDDSSYFEEEDKAIISETVAKWLREKLT